MIFIFEMHALTLEKIIEVSWSVLNLKNKSVFPYNENKPLWLLLKSNVNRPQYTYFYFYITSLKN
jgi:hypothetical protein